MPSNANYPERIEQVTEAFIATNLGWWEHDILQKHTTWSPKCRELYGLFTDREITYADWIATVHPDDFERVEQQVQNAIQSTGYYDEEFTTIGIEDRKLRRVRSIAKVLHNEEGVPVKLAGIIIETTKPEVAKPIAHDGDFQLKLIADTMPQLVWTTLPDGYHDFYNRRWYEYTGLTHDKTKGESWNDVLHPDDQERAWKIWNHSLQTGEPYEIEYRFKRYDGQYRWFLGRALPQRDENGSIVKWYGTCTDIHDQKTASELLEQRVIQRTQELEIRNKELEQFAYVSHHDLQEPLRKILTFSDMVKLESYDRLTEPSRKRLDKVMDAAHRMRMALTDVLNFASLSKEEQFTPVALNEVLANVHSDLELLLAEKNANLYSEELPIINAVQGQMHQLLYNLVNNALKFSKAGQAPIINITCRALSTKEISELSQLEHGKPYYEITIKDNGIGFHQEDSDKIFEIFQRLHSKHAYEGTGIGLALCRKIVLNHGGLIWAEGKDAEGATFKIVLPAK
jgi:PAS domain S-box-containing protein